MGVPQNIMRALCACNAAGPFKICFLRACISSSAVVEHTVFINMAELAHAAMKCDNNLWRRINVNML